MSSDEEEKVPDGIQYRVIAPRWRAPMLTPWLRMFDAIYRYHRLEDNTSDMRGALPRRRVPSTAISTSRKFVPGLPINAYMTSWLEEQLDIANVVHPGPKITYTHDPRLSEYVVISGCILLLQLTNFEVGNATAHIASPIRPHRLGSIRGAVVNIGASLGKFCFCPSHQLQSFHVSQFRCDVVFENTPSSLKRAGGG